MTREEAVARIENHKIVHKMNEPRAIYISEALDMAIKALEQQPCSDAISRQAVLEQTYNWSKDEFLRVTNPFDYLRKRINSLPPVNPQPKTGYWEHGRELSRVFMSNVLKGINYEDWHCSNCHCVIEQSIKPKWNYCPNCGTKMVKSQESEVSDADSN